MPQHACARCHCVSPPCPPRPPGTQCCPINWLEYEGSCYWFSRSGKTWADADRYCRLESAHLVVINSREEQVGRAQAAFFPVSNQRESQEAEPGEVHGEAVADSSSWDIVKAKSSGQRGRSQVSR